MEASQNNGIFKSIYFGKRYKTRDMRTAVFLDTDEEKTRYMLWIEGEEKPYWYDMHGKALNEAYTQFEDGTVETYGTDIVGELQEDTNYVDLGLPSGTLWAKCNVGAATETDYGDYFMWGSTTPDTNTPCDWTHVPFNNGSSDFDETYFNAHKSEWLTEEGNLKPQYDAAHVIMGGDWRMPTKTDFDELLEGTTNEWVTNYQGSGVNGILFTSKKNGNTMFMPAAGSRCGSSFYGQGDNGVVWSSLLYTDYLGGAWELYFDSCSCYMCDDYRYGGFSVRGVLNK